MFIRSNPRTKILAAFTDSATRWQQGTSYGVALHLGTAGGLGVGWEYIGVCVEAEIHYASNTRLSTQT